MDKLSLTDVTLKLVVLVLLVSGQRGQTVHLLSIDHMVPVNNCYTFQIVDHLKQSRPGVKNPLVELRPFEDKSPCVVTTLKEYLTRTQSLQASKACSAPCMLPGFSIIGSNWLLHMAVLSCTVTGQDLHFRHLSCMHVLV